MTDIDFFLKALVKVLDEKGKKIALAARWSSVRDEKFPAYKKFTLEVCEIFNGTLTNRFIVQKAQNMSDMSAYPDAEKIVKQDMITEMIRIILKYYMYGEVVQ